MFVLVRMDRMRVFCDVAVADADRIKVGDKARIRVASLDDRLIGAELTRISFAADPLTRTVRAEIELPSSDGKLRPGMSAKVSFRIEYKNVWVLPKNSLILQDTVVGGEDGTVVEGGKAVYRVENGTAILTPVRTGISTEGLVQVLSYRPRADGGDWRDFTGAEQIIQRPWGWTAGMTVGKKPSP